MHTTRQNAQASIANSLQNLLTTLAQQLKPAAAQARPQADHTHKHSAPDSQARTGHAATTSHTISHPHTTRFFAPLHGKVMVLLDAQNLSYTLRNHHGWDVDYTALLMKIYEQCTQYPASVLAHAFLRMTNPDDATYAARYFAGAGCVPHIALASSGAPTNADNDMLVAAVQLLRRRRPDTLIIGTGDGELGCSLASHAVETLPHIAVHTLSISGSTSGRLWRTRNPHVRANTLIGMDLIRPIH